MLLSAREKRFAFIAVAGGLTAALLIIEVILRHFPPGWLTQRMAELNAGSPYRFASDAGWPVVKDADGTFISFRPGSSFPARHYEYAVTAHIDEMGGRLTGVAPGNGRLVPFLGDSFTFGVGVEDRQTFVSLLASSSSGRFLNLGVPGTALDAQLDILERRHKSLGRPRRYVFAVFLGNDLEDIRGHYARGQVAEHRSRGKAALGQWLDTANAFAYHNRWLKQSYTIQFVRKQLLAGLNHGAPFRMNPVFLAMRRDLPYLTDSIVFFRKEVRRLHGLSRRLDFRPIFVLIPDVHQVDAGRLRNKCDYYDIEPQVIDVTQPGSAIAEVLKEFGIRYLDITACLARAAGREALYYVQDNHLTSRGHREAANCMAENGFFALLDGGSAAVSRRGALE